MSDTPPQPRPPIRSTIERRTIDDADGPTVSLPSPAPRRGAGPGLVATLLLLGTLILGILAVSGLLFTGPPPTPPPGTEPTPAASTT